MEQLSILLMVLPLLFAPVTALVSNGRLAWTFSFVLCSAMLVLSIILLISIQGGTIIHYELGGWQPPWGIEYVLDPLNGLIALILSTAAWLCCLYSYRSLHNIDQEKLPLFHASFQLCLLGLMGISLTGDIFNLFVFLEVSSLATYAMVAMGKNKQSLLAAFNYLILGTLGATCFLIGVGLLYAATGSLNMAELAILLPQTNQQHLLNSGVAFIVIGLGLKAAVFPLHHWLPAVYTQSPSVVSVFLSATATKVAIYALVRFIFGIVGYQAVVDTLLPNALMLAGCSAVLYGSYCAMQQRDLKAIFAYSSLAQIGYMVMGISLLSEAGLTAGLLHLFNHSMVKACLFMVAGLLLYRANTTHLDELQGMGKLMKTSFVLMLVAGLSLVGIPGTVGFVSKWLLISAAWSSGAWPLVVVVIAGSLMAVRYIWRIVETLYFSPAEKMRIKQVEAGDHTFSRSPATMFFPALFLALGCVYFGLQSQLPLSLAQQASQLMLSSAP